MKTLLKLALTLMALLCAVVPLSAGTPAAQRPAAAATTAGKVRYYSVYYRISPHYSWAYYNSYVRLADARYVALAIRYYYGYETFIR